MWFQHQLAHVLKGWVAGGGTTTKGFIDLECHSSVSAPGWKCLVPSVGSAGIPGIRSLELGSGLALCVRGSIRGAFFTKFRGGYTPDSFAKKGMIAVHFAPPGLSPRAMICTHFHDFSNDKFGGARRNNLEQLASVVKWIDLNWRVPVAIVGDFNIDSRDAYLNKHPTIDHSLYKALVSTAKPSGAFWCDMNAQLGAFKPVPTQSDANGAIDMHLLSSRAGMSKLAFERFRFADHRGVAYSDHQMLRSSWSEP